MQDGAVKDDESIKHSDVLVEDQEKIKKHAKKLEKKEPVELEKKTRNWEKFSSKYWNRNRSNRKRFWRSWSGQGCWKRTIRRTFWSALENPKVIAEILVEIRGPKSTTESIVKRAEKFKESNIELFEAIYEAVERVADEITIEEIVINSNIETIDKIAGGEAADDNTAGERVEELTIDPSVELAVLEAVDRVDEEADKSIVEEIVINSSIEAIIDKFAGDEAINDNTIDPSIELAVS